MFWVRLQISKYWCHTVFLHICNKSKYWCHVTVCSVWVACADWLGVSGRHRLCSSASARQRRQEAGAGHSICTKLLTKKWTFFLTYKRTFFILFCLQCHGLCSISARQRRRPALVGAGLCRHIEPFFWKRQLAAVSCCSLPVVRVISIDFVHT